MCPRGCRPFSTFQGHLSPPEWVLDVPTKRSLQIPVALNSRRLGATGCATACGPYPGLHGQKMRRRAKESLWRVVAAQGKMKHLFSVLFSCSKLQIPVLHVQKEFPYSLSSLSTQELHLHLIIFKAPFELWYARYALSTWHDRRLQVLSRPRRDICSSDLFCIYLFFDPLLFMEMGYY